MYIYILNYIDQYEKKHSNYWDWKQQIVILTQYLDWRSDKIDELRF